MITTNPHINEAGILEIPCFFEDRIGDIVDYAAVLDEQTVVKIRISPKWCVISNGLPEAFALDLKSVYKNYRRISEDEFFAAHDKAMEAQRLRPVLSNVVVEPIGREVSNG